MLPLIGVAVIASRSCELEHRGHTLKLLETAVTPGRLYAAKLAWGAPGAGRPAPAAHGALFLALGLAMGFPGRDALGAVRCVPLPPCSWAVSMTLYALQQGLSLRFANQAVALAMRHLRQLRGTHGPALPRVGTAVRPLGVLRPALSGADGMG